MADCVWEINKKNSNSRSQILNGLKGHEYDFIFCPHESIRSAAWVLQLKSKEKIGFKKWWNFFVFTKRVQKNKKLPDALRQLSLLQTVSIDITDKIKNYSGGVPEWASMSLVNEINKTVHPLKWQLKQPVLFLAPGSVWATKRWTRDGYKKVAQEFGKTHTVVFVGTSDERELCASLQEELPNSLNLAGQTSVLDLLFLFKNGKLLICNDSGAMHVASAAGLPTAAVFGPTVLGFGYQPWQTKSTVIEKKMSCRPCGKHGHQVCPIGTHACMKDISADEVLEKARKLIQDPSH